MATSLLGLLLWAIFLPALARSADFVVTNSNSHFAGSLRQAILDANANPGPDNISFNIPGPGPHLISPTEPLPEIVSPVFIDGYSQPGSQANTLQLGNNAVLQIVVDGNGINGGGEDGLRLAASNCVVSGLVFQNHGGAAIVVSNGVNCSIRGNLIGGVFSNGNDRQGISIEGSINCTVGGSQRADRNQILANSLGGIRLFNSASNRIVGNEIHRNLGPGIVLAGMASQNNLVETNRITTNQVGILVRSTAGSHNSFLGNSIYDNAGLGIDLNEDGVTLNDPGDLDDGPNGLQNSPKLVLVKATNALAFVDGFLESAPLAAYRLDFFSSPAPDPSQYGEGRVFIGAINVMTDASGHFNFRLGLPIVIAQWVTATATSASGDTSEFSEAEIVGTAPGIFAEPLSQTVFAGDTVALSVEVGGIPPFSFQWFLGESPLVGETNQTLVLPNVQSQPDCYQVLITNRFGQVLSQPACLTIRPRPSISQDPVSVTASQGDPGLFCVTVESTGPVTYQWRLNGVNLVGATNNCYDISNISIADQGLYYAVITTENTALISPRAFLSIPEISRPPTSDNFADRVLLMGVEGAIGGLNILATREPGEPSHGGKAGSKSVWYCWEAPASGVATLNTAGSAFDTLLAVYTGADLQNLNLISRDEDRGGFLSSRLQFNVQAGSRYQIAIDGFAGASGAFILRWDLVVTNALLPEFQTQPASGVVSPGSSFAFAVEANGPGLTYQWFFNGTPLPGATEPIVTVSNVQPQNTGPYFVRVSSTGGALDSEPAFLEIDSATAFLSADKPEDLFGPSNNGAGGGPIGSFVPVAAGSVGTHVMSNVDATGSFGEPLHCGVIGGASQWYGLMATEDSLLVIDTEGSDFDTVLAVYSGPPVFTEDLFFFLVLEACDDNSAADGIRSKVCLSATAGTHYYVAVDGVSTSRGNISLNWNLSAAPPITATAERQLLRIGSDLVLGSRDQTPGKTHQWQRNGANLAGATNSSLPLCNLRLNQAGDYRLISVMGSAPTLGPLLRIATARLNFQLIPGMSESAFHVNGSASHEVRLETTVVMPADWTTAIPSILPLDPYSYSANLIPEIPSSQYFRLRLVTP